MDQQVLWHDSIYDALGALVSALGGPKAVGYLLWKAKPIKDSQRLVLHCLDAERPEKFSPDEVELLMAEGRRVGCHVLAEYLGRRCHYEFRATNPRDRKGELQREFIESTKRMELLAREIQALEGLQ